VKAFTIFSFAPQMQLVKAVNGNFMPLAYLT